MKLNIPRILGNPLQITLSAGDRLFMVGANGSGKSALIQHLVSAHKGTNFRRVSAHRQTWLSSGSIDLTPRRRQELGKEVAQLEARREARWRDEQAHQKLIADLFDLVAIENQQARRIRRLIHSGHIEEAKKADAEELSPFDQINELFSIANLPIGLEVHKGEEILARNVYGGDLYSIAQMSDGERSATFIAAAVLTVEKGTVLYIDEPERHLHRSIIGPFLSALFRQRKDCTFVISTHEIDLPIADPEARVLILRSCTWDKDKALAWDVDRLPENSELPEDLKQAILGSRKRILFVEGDNTGSLDHALYDALFPDILIKPRGSFSKVQKAVDGIRNSEDYHHIEAFGLIDRDSRSDEEVEKLTKDSVFALTVSSVEALYYCSDAIAAVAFRQAETLGRDADEMIEFTTRAALEALQGNALAERMAARRCERIVRTEIVSGLPNWKDIMGNSQVNFSFSVAVPFPDELALFRKLLSNSELDQLVARYPLRETDALDAISRTLEFRNRKLYQQTLIARVHDDATLAQKLKERIGPLSSILCK